MKPLTPIGSPSPLRLLNKGPDYLRRQIDGGGHGRSVSAVERLEADKAKYVKSQQVINTKQEPVLVPCATPPPPPRRAITIPGSLTPHLPPRRPSNTPFPPVCGSFAARDENENDDSRKENRRTSVDVEAHNRSNVNNAPPSPRTPGLNTLVAPHSAPILRRSTGKRMLRPDSLVIYRRQFGELRRSKSDLHLRCSVALSEQEHFFDFCGLDVDMVERLGRQNFLSGASSIDTLSLALRSVGGDGCGGSEPSEFSRHSGDGLFEEELAEQLPTGVSIIERNARVIKWLYGCKNAAREGPKESTV
ncbi:protein FAM110B [Neolamprologus brichardi]|uniref:protein FAM110B n=1 Tax=Neolamprologus brichardi TaxID=32507 RepID=UPI0003EC1942|nr:protein FAM110B [Neolamprologus brichardi]